MEYSKRVIATLLLLQVFFTQAKDSCILVPVGSNVLCKGRDISDLKSALGALTGRIRAGVLLIVEDTKIEGICAETSTIAHKGLRICKNKNLTSIDPMAFASSAITLEISESPNLDNSVWKFVSKLSAMVDLRFYKVGVTEVPADAFGKGHSLTEIRLAHNSITTFKASVGGRNLKLLDLSFNALNNDSFSQGVFEGTGLLEELWLFDNPEMTQLEKSQFEGLLNKGTRVFVGRSSSPGGNYMECRGAEWLCDEKVGGGYLCENVRGYKCVDMKTEIYHYCVAHHNLKDGPFALPRKN